jgi:hypothetical protein
MIVHVHPNPVTVSQWLCCCWSSRTAAASCSCAQLRLAQLPHSSRSDRFPVQRRPLDNRGHLLKNPPPDVPILERLTHYRQWRSAMTMTCHVGTERSGVGARGISGNMVAHGDSWGSVLGAGLCGSCQGTPCTRTTTSSSFWMHYTP